MSPSRLTPNDASVLEKIKDPESVAAPVLIDDSLPRDPNITDPVQYASAKEIEMGVITTILSLEKKEVSFSKQKAKINPTDPRDFPDDNERAFRTSQLAGWLACIIRLDKLIEKHPKYASAMNNRAQVLKMVYGEGMMVKLCTETDYPVSDGLPALDPYTIPAQDSTLEQVSRKVLGDLTAGIVLLSPRTIFAGVSPTQAKTLSQLHIQRGALYRVTAKKLALDGIEGTAERRIMNGRSAEGVRLKAEFRMKGEAKEASWSSVEFEENASRDFMMAGRYGSDIGKGLAVSTNPTAKLCGEMVKEAMKKEYAGEETRVKKKENVVEEKAVKNLGASEYAVNKDNVEADELAGLQKLGQLMSSEMGLDAID